MFRIVSRNCETIFRFVSRIFSFKFCTYSSSFCYFHSSFVPFIGISYLLFKCRTFYSSFVAFFNRYARTFLKYLHSSILSSCSAFPSRRTATPPPFSPLHTNLAYSLTTHTHTHNHHTHSPHTFLESYFELIVLG